MSGQSKYILTINCGSSSLKFSLYHSSTLQLECVGSVSHIGTKNGQLKISDSNNKIIEQRTAAYLNLEIAAKEVLDLLKNQRPKIKITAIGHRLVQGGPKHRQPAIINAELLQELKEFIYLAPNHLPTELQTIKIFQSAFTEVPQVACFDTSFHRDMPSYTKNYPLPAIYRDMGLLRYGFHGLSYEYIMQTLSEKYLKVFEKKIIIAHLGNGASMAAVKNGICVDTTMGLTPIGGLVMGTRSGDLDPGVLLYLLKQAKLNVNELDEMLSKHSGLIAIAGTSDMQKLLNTEAANPEAKEAVTVFCYYAKKFIGAMAAAMGGLDMLVFTGGIGENSAPIRERICAGLEFMGIEINQKLNHMQQETISFKASRVTVKVLETNEEKMIALHTKKYIM